MNWARQFDRQMNYKVIDVPCSVCKAKKGQPCKDARAGCYHAGRYADLTSFQRHVQKRGPR